MSALPVDASDGGFDPETFNALIRQDLANFVRLVFHELNPGKTLVWDDYLDVLCSTVQGLVRGDTRRQVVAMPPRHLKSVVCSVALPAWYLGHHPDRTVMVVCYGKDLTRDLALATQRVMQSRWYQAAFSTRLKSAKQSLEKLVTTRNGGRHATSIDGAATGFGADLMIFDDPQKAGDVQSEALRLSTNRAFSETFLSRQNDPKNSRMLIVQQRFHEEDFIGYVTAQVGEPWSSLSLPAIAEQEERHVYRNWMDEEQVWTRRPGDLLHPGRLGQAELDEIRLKGGEAVWAAQYQQRPTPVGGGIVQTAWFKRYETRPARFDRIIQSWDTASKTTARHDFSVCVTFGVVDKDIYILDVLRDRLEYPDLKAKVTIHAGLFNASRVLIEDAAAGMALLQELHNAGFHRAHAVTPSRGKEVRMEGQTGYIRSGFVHLPQDAHWLPEFLHELEVFPKGKFDDQVDALSQGLEHLANYRMPQAGLYEFYRQEAEGRPVAEEPIVLMKYEPGGARVWASLESVHYGPDPRGVYRFPESEAIKVQRSPGWRRLTIEEIRTIADEG